MDTFFAPADAIIRKSITDKTKCATCVHLLRSVEFCDQYDKRKIKDGGLTLVISCAGYQKETRPAGWE